jgi:hypothetical protein
MHSINQSIHQYFQIPNALTVFQIVKPKSLIWDCSGGGELLTLLQCAMPLGNWDMTCHEGSRNILRSNTRVKDQQQKRSLIRSTIHPSIAPNRLPDWIPKLNHDTHGSQPMKTEAEFSNPPTANLPATQNPDDKSQV